MLFIVQYFLQRIVCADSMLDVNIINVLNEIMRCSKNVYSLQHDAKANYFQTPNSLVMTCY